MRPKRRCPVCTNHPRLSKNIDPTGQALDDVNLFCQRGHIWNPFTGEVLRGHG